MMHANNNFRRFAALFAITLLSALLLCMPLIVGAQETENLTNNGLRFTSISGIPGLDSTAAGGQVNTGEFLRNIYRMAIIIAAIIAVIKLILAGVQYSLSGVVTKKENAKRDIRSALVGLLIILAAITLLTQINPDITNLPALQDLPSNVQLSGVPQNTNPRNTNPGQFTVPDGYTLTDQTRGLSQCTADAVTTNGPLSYDYSACESACEASGGTVVSSLGTIVECNTRPDWDAVAECVTTTPNDPNCNSVKCDAYTGTHWLQYTENGTLTYTCSDNAGPLGCTSLGTGTEQCNETQCDRYGGAWLNNDVFIGERNSGNYTCYEPGSGAATNGDKTFSVYDVLEARTARVEAFGFTEHFYSEIDINDPAQTGLVEAFQDRCSGISEGFVETYQQAGNIGPKTYVCYSE